MTEPDQALRDALRDLIPDYTGPVDPLPRVLATVRRRRNRQRVLLAVSGTAAAAVLALAMPALLLARSGGGQAAGPGVPNGPVPSRPVPSGPAPTASGGGGSPAPPPPVYPVASGTVGDAHWAIGTTSLTPDARLCVISDDDVARQEVICFDGWKAGGPVTFAAQPMKDRTLAVTRIAGVAPAGTASVRIRLAAGAPLTLPVKPTATDPDARFFGWVLEGTVVVRDVTALDAADKALGPAATEPELACRSGPNLDCAAPK
jgi:hypothetical protein